MLDAKSDDEQPKITMARIAKPGKWQGYGLPTDPIEDSTKWSQAKFSGTSKSQAALSPTLPDSHATSSDGISSSWVPLRDNINKYPGTQPTPLRNAMGPSRVVPDSPDYAGLLPDTAEMQEFLHLAMPLGHANLPPQSPEDLPTPEDSSLPQEESLLPPSPKESLLDPILEVPKWPTCRPGTPEWPLDLQVLPDLRKCEWATREYWINRGMCHDPLGFYPKFAKVGPWIVKLPKRRRTDESDPNDQTDGQPDNSEPAESSELVESSEPVTHWHGM